MNHALPRRILSDEFQAEQMRGHKWVVHVSGYVSQALPDIRRFVTARTREEVVSRATRFTARLKDAKEKASHQADREVRKLGLTPPDKWHNAHRRIAAKLTKKAFRSIKP